MVYNIHKRINYMHIPKLNSFTIFVTLLYALCVVGLNVSQAAYAVELSMRRIVITNPTPSATTTHRFDFTVNTVSPVGSMSFEYCGNSPLPSQPCVPPVGLSLTGAILAAQSGETGFTIDPSSTGNKLVLSRPIVATSVGAASYTVNNVVNTSTATTTYVRISTYATTDGTGSSTDFGAVAFSTNSGFGAEAFVPPYLRFCTGVTVSLDCNTTSGVLANLGELLPNRTSAATSQFAAYTNDGSGYAVAMTGVTMTSGNHVIPAMTNADTSQTGLSQFGMNLRANSVPSSGADPVGAGTGTAQPGYNLSNRFKFVSGDTIVISTLPTQSNVFTASYMVNVNSAQPPGIYSSTITYICTAQF